MGTAPVEVVELSKDADARPRNEVVETFYEALIIPPQPKPGTAGGATGVGVQELDRPCRRYWRCEHP